MDDPGTLLTGREAATLLRLSERTMERHRAAGTGPRYIVLGRAIRYRRSDVARLDRARCAPQHQRAGAMTSIRRRGAAQQRRSLGPMVPAMIRMHRKWRPATPIDFGAVARAELTRLPDLLARWLPGGRIEGAEYVA